MVAHEVEAGRRDQGRQLLHEFLEYITYDGLKMLQHSEGMLDVSQLGEPTSSDTVRLAREMERRGLK